MVTYIDILQQQTQQQSVSYDPFIFNMAVISLSQILLIFFKLLYMSFSVQ